MIITGMISSTLKLLAASLILWAPIYTPADSQHISSGTTAFEVSNYALEVACKYAQWDCVGTPAPHVDYSFYVQVMGWMGAYSWEGDPEGVWLHPEFLGKLSIPEAIDPLAFAILLHETVHYLDYHLNGPFPGSCATESLAWSITLTWLDNIEQSHIAAEFRDWRSWYGCDVPNDDSTGAVVR